MALAEIVTAERESTDPAHAVGVDTVAPLVVCLGQAYQDASSDIASLVPWLREYTAGSPVVIGYPVTQGNAPAERLDEFTLEPLSSLANSTNAVVPTAAAWLNAQELVRTHGARACLLLGGEAKSLGASATSELLESVTRGGADLAVPRYDLPNNQALLNTAVLSPLSRAIFNVHLGFPLALDFACSARMVERMAAAAQRATANSQADAILWPVAEAAVAGYSLAEVPVGPRAIPQVDDDLGTILNRVAGSLFSDVEAKASFWQRTRPAVAVLHPAGFEGVQDAQPLPPSAEEVNGLVESFRNGYRNLHEIWSLVLPPNTLVTLKRLSVAPAPSFQLPDATWVRIVYDFVLAHRLRTIARNHLMGAFAPLYLAWVASYLAQGGSNAQVDSLARAFESDKPYLVSRWRWPDRFNP